MRDVPKLGCWVTLRPERSDAYGEPRDIVYTVIRIKARPGYKVPWIEILPLGGTGLEIPGCVKPGELRKAE